VYQPRGVGLIHLGIRRVLLTIHMTALPGASTACTRKHAGPTTLSRTSRPPRATKPSLTGCFNGNVAIWHIAALCWVGDRSQLGR
jgi:hypothetical protein